MKHAIMNKRERNFHRHRIVGDVLSKYTKDFRGEQIVLPFAIFLVSKMMCNLFYNTLGVANRYFLLSLSSWLNSQIRDVIMIGRYKLGTIFAIAREIGAENQLI